jgi:hypothetical protein
MGMRALISLTSGRCAADIWAMAVAEEEPVAGKPRGCKGCPLRVGGEWDEGAAKMLGQASEDLCSDLEQWGCHDAKRPCAGTRRLLSIEPSA